MRNAWLRSSSDGGCARSQWAIAGTTSVNVQPWFVDVGPEGAGVERLAEHHARPRHVRRVRDGAAPAHVEHRERRVEDVVGTEVVEEHHAEGEHTPRRDDTLRRAGRSRRVDDRLHGPTASAARGRAPGSRHRGTRRARAPGRRGSRAAGGRVASGTTTVFSVGTLDATSTTAGRGTVRRSSRATRPSSFSVYSSMKPRYALLIGTS